MMEIICLRELDRTVLEDFFVEHWGSPQMAYSHESYNCLDLDGFAALSGAGQMIGLITYDIKNSECSIVSLDSLEENKGIGSMLMEKAEKEAASAGCIKIKVTTTNDNLRALGFYQKRDFACVELLPGAVEKARSCKPDIPLIAENGIPIRDEFILEKVIES